VLLGFASVKDVGEIDMTPGGVNFINIVLEPFSTEVFCVAFLELQFGFVIFGVRISVLKLLIKC